MPSSTRSPARRSALHDVAIVGAFNTEQAKVLPGETSASLLDKAIFGALDDAGMSVDEVDGLNVTRGVEYPTPPPDYVVDPQSLLGPRPCWIGQHAFGIDAVAEAAMAISLGLCSTVVIGNAQAGSHRRDGGSGATAPWTRPTYEFAECWGLYTAAEFALLARRHMHLFDTTPQQLAEVAATIRSNGARNPAAVMHGREVKPGDVLASRMIADPFHLLDCALTSEGGGAVVLTTVERARDLDRPAVRLLGAGTEVRGTGYIRPPTWEAWGWLGEHAAATAFRMAGLGPADVDFCELYDPFSFEIIHQLEAFGFCGRGEGGPFVMGGRIALDGELPICTDGGLQSFSHPGQVQMLQRVIEGVQQLRGRGGERQVRDPNVGLVSNNAMAIRSVLLLGADEAIG